ncbi:MAG: molecular chaperone HtpG [Zavarzinella sp.]
MSAEQMEFRTELKQLLHLITHSLYSNREIFLRELISNASDAINKLRFDAIANEAALEGNADWKIKITTDPANSTLTISDSGVGMNRQDAIEHLGTIAKSGTKAFLENLKAAQQATEPDLIGQFGVGFYSAFMVADKVTVHSRKAGEPGTGIRWESDGQGSFSIEDAPREQRGTDVILHLKEDAKEFLDSYRIRHLVKQFSDFIEHPIVMDETTKAEDGTETTEEETINARRALWLQQPREITAEEYNGFYKTLTNDFNDPIKVIHYNKEGKSDYRVLAFIPKEKPFSFTWEDPKGMKLYVQRVQIMESCDGLLPNYLRFVRGVVDSNDLPLNISRELLQSNPVLERIQKDLVRQIIEALEFLKGDQFDAYLHFYKDYSPALKEAAVQDYTNREKFSDLLLFESTKTEEGKYTTLSEYVERMPADQKEIYYLIGEEKNIIENSPLLESFKSKGWEVLLLTETIDEYLMPSMGKFRDKELKAIDRADTTAAEDPAIPREDEFKNFLEYLKSILPQVEDVKLSKRLKESPSCLIAGKNGMTPAYEKLMQRMGRATEPAKRILEINAENPVINKIKGMFEQNPHDPLVESCSRLVYEQAVIAEGSTLSDPAGFARRLNQLIVLMAPTVGENQV